MRAPFVASLVFGIGLAPAGAAACAQGKPELLAPNTPLGSGWPVLNSQAVRSVDRLGDDWVKTSRDLFDHPETALRETRSSAALAALAEQAGFKVERGVSQMETAWVATWSSGAGGPTLGILAEF
ncbi:MAG TPA: hypothetical protein VFG37_11250, partial [Planctomycetota bacterium]|nr:hypothetical protein [Planctomycetota bacterium]